MGDAYWRYADSRQPLPQSIQAVVGKRPRSDYGGRFPLSFISCCARSSKFPLLCLYQQIGGFSVSFPFLSYFQLFSDELSKIELASLRYHLTKRCPALSRWIKFQSLDVSSGHDLPNYYPRDDDRGALRGVRDSDSIGASYDRYLRSVPISPYSGGQSARLMRGGVPSRPVDDPRLVGMGSMDSGAEVKDRMMRMGSGRPEVSLPPDASSTLFVEGLPPDCTRREVSHIFRPFVGYKEVRLVSKESRHPGGNPLILCFVDFASPAHAATALDALQGLLVCSQSSNWVQVCRALE